MNGGDAWGRYLNFPYIVRGESPWDIVNVWTKPLDLSLGSVGHGFVFTSSILLDADGLVTVCYNVNDRSSMFFRRPLQWFLEQMSD